jgi:hypothetical protein
MNLLCQLGSEDRLLVLTFVAAAYTIYAKARAIRREPQDWRTTILRTITIFDMLYIMAICGWALSRWATNSMTDILLTMPPSTLLVVLEAVHSRIEW